MTKTHHSERSMTDLSRLKDVPRQVLENYVRVRHEPGWEADAIDAATRELLTYVTPPLRTRAEVDAEIVRVVRNNELSWAETLPRLVKLKTEPTCEEPAPADGARAMTEAALRLAEEICDDHDQDIRNFPGDGSDSTRHALQQYITLRDERRAKPDPAPELRDPEPCSCEEATTLKQYMHDALRALDPEQGRAYESMREAAEMLRRGLGE